VSMFELRRSLGSSLAHPIVAARNLRTLRETCMRGAVAAVVLCAPLLAAGQATLGAKGDTIHGRVADLTAEGVVFEPASGTGQIAVKWADVQSLETEGNYTVLHGAEGEARGRILGFEDGKFILVGDAPATAERLEIGTLFHAYDESKAAGSWVERMRSRLRFWTATLDASSAYTNSTTDTLAGAAGILIDRKKAPTHLLFEAGAIYASEDEQHEERTITENALFAFGRGELDLTDHWYTYASSRFTHDNQLHLALRAEPRGGAGYHFIKSKTRNFSTDVGLAWIYESYFGDEFDVTTGIDENRGSNNFWSIAFGAQGDAVLAYGAILRGRVEYLPSVDDWQDDYLARAETSLDLPMLHWLAFRIAFADEYDNTPAPGAQHNKFSSTAGIAIRFVP
jgi:hypothetical protein